LSHPRLIANSSPALERGEMREDSEGHFHSIHEPTVGRKENSISEIRT
jgi:hypothetical protein